MGFTKTDIYLLKDLAVKGILVNHGCKMYTFGTTESLTLSLGLSLQI